MPPKNKSPLDYTPEEKAQHVGSVRDAVESFLRESGVGAKFSDLVAFMSNKFRMADEEMFKEWTEKEFPGQFTYTHTHQATYDDADEPQDD